MIHTVKGFGKVSKAEIDVFLELSCVFDDPVEVSNLISGSSAFSKTSLNICKFTVHVLLNEAWLGQFWALCYWCVRWVQLCGSLNILWDWNENWPFPVLWPPLSFQICWHIECSTFTASSFRIWNSSTEIALPPLALFIVMLPKAHLTSHSRMSGSGWVTTPSWLSGSWRSFLCSSSVYSCHILISSASVRSIPFLSFIVPIFAWNVPLVSPIFLKRSLAFPILLFSSISLHWSLRKAFLSLLAILWKSAFKWVYLSSSPLLLASLLLTAICKASSDNHFYLLRFFFLGMDDLDLCPIQCNKPLSIVYQALCLSDIVPSIYFSFPLYNHKGFDLGHSWMV